MNKKRIIILLTIAVLISLGLFMAVFHLRSGLDYQTFQNRLPSIITPLQLTEIELRTYDPHLVSQPFIIRFLKKLTGRPSNTLATPESLTRILFEQPNGKRLWLSIRLSGENINSLVVYSDTNAESEAKKLRDSLTKAFPSQSIDLKLNQDALPQP